MRRAPSPSRTMSSASWRSSASSAWPKRSSDVGLGLRRSTPLAPEHCRITVSLVESWPSTEMRSNERLTQTPSSRSAVSALSTASVCTKQSIVAKAGWIIPAPLAWAVRRTVPPGSVDLERRALLERVGGHDRRLEVARRRPDAARRAPARGRATTASASSCTPITPVERDRDLVDRPRRRPSRPRPAPWRRVVEPATAGRGVRVARVDRDDAQRVQPRALLGDAARARASGAGAGEARRGDSCRGRVGDQQPDVGAAAGLDARPRRPRRGSPRAAARAPRRPSRAAGPSG